MRLFTIEYEEFHIGVMTWVNASDNIIKYAIEIHCTCLSNKPLYLFLKNHICVLSHENVDDGMVQLKVAGVFTQTDIPKESPATYNRFKFDPDHNTFAFEASLQCKTGPKTKSDLENSLKMFRTTRIFLAFDVIKSTF